ncbi:MAG TPA: response regulator [Thermoanaerobaculia bacterium]|jgi:CheY-like chemotaxis protein|nr:response regulator [Thermoanaerobaculia bacterium]
MIEKRAAVLIVDDDEATLRALRGFLEVEGYAVETARDGQEALEKLDAMEAPGLILLDLKMPVMDGWEFLSERSHDRKSRKVPVVLLSGLPYIPNAPGVADFLSKPVNPVRLLTCVRRFCGPEREVGDSARRTEPRP